MLTFKIAFNIVVLHWIFKLHLKTIWKIASLKFEKIQNHFLNCKFKHKKFELTF